MIKYAAVIIEPLSTLNVIGRQVLHDHEAERLKQFWRTTEIWQDEKPQPWRMKMRIDDTIREAIDRSISHNEIVHVEVDAIDGQDIHDWMTAIQSDCWDYSTENDGSLDVYSTDDSWRIKVTVTDMARE